MNNKSQAGSIFIVLVILVVVLLVWGFLSYANTKIVNSINDNVQINDGLSNESKIVMQQFTSDYSGWSDTAFAIIFGLMWLVVLVLAYYMDSSPLVFIIFVIFIIVLVILGMMLSNVWDSFQNQFDNSYVTSFPVTNFVLQNYGLVVFVIVISGFLVSFMKNRVIG